MDGRLLVAGALGVLGVAGKLRRGGANEWDEVYVYEVAPEELVEWQVVDLAGALSRVLGR